jgi:hypothetical protein
MRLCVVHDDHVAATLVEPVDKTIGVRGLEQRGLHDPAAEPDRADGSQVLARVLIGSLSMNSSPHFTHA